MLAWALAPEDDRIVAPPIASNPATLIGTFSYNEARNGFMLRTAQGKDYLVLPDMMPGGSTEAMLSSLARLSAGERFEARGRLAVKDQGYPFFDHRHCIYVYRLPR